MTDDGVYDQVYQRIPKPAEVGKGYVGRCGI